jgi:hypothetical protein
MMMRVMMPAMLLLLAVMASELHRCRCCEISDDCDWSYQLTNAVPSSPLPAPYPLQRTARFQ